MNRLREGRQAVASKDSADRGQRLRLTLLGGASSVSVNVGGQLLVSEIVMLTLLPFVILDHRGAGFRQPVRRAITFLALWLVGTLAADLYHATALADVIRGASTIVFTGVDLCVLHALFQGSARRAQAFFVGIALADVLRTAVAPTVLAQVDTWKFGYALPVGILVSVVLIERHVRPRLGALALGAFALVNVLLFYRSMAGIAVATGAALLFVDRQRTRNQVSGLRILIALSAVAAGLAACVSIAGSLASSGALGPHAQAKQLDQGRGTLGLLIGGRGEVVYSSQALIRSPLVGYGSNPQLTSDLESHAQNTLVSAGYPIKVRTALDPTSIPTHSYLLGSWVEAGVLALPFWLFFLQATVRLFRSSLSEGHRTAPLTLLLASNAMWSVFFSPFGLDQRILVAGVLAFSMLQPRADEEDEAIGQPSSS